MQKSPGEGQALLFINDIVIACELQHSNTAFHK